MRTLYPASEGCLLVYFRITGILACLYAAGFIIRRMIRNNWHGLGHTPVLLNHVGGSAATAACVRYEEGPSKAGKSNSFAKCINAVKMDFIQSPFW